MNITVINGSPKGKYSITYQSVRYLEKRRTGVSFSIFHVGAEIKKLGAREELFHEIIDAVAASDAVMWVYPVYTFLVPYQLARFIELIFELKAEAAFKGKYCSQLSTSKHFFDVTAANYIRAVSEDLGMHYIAGHCADTEDLPSDTGRRQLSAFFDEVEYAVKNKLPLSRKYFSVPPSHEAASIPDRPPRRQPERDNPGAPHGKRVVILTDCTEEDRSLRRMIDIFRDSLPLPVEEINLRDVPLKGGCLGCLSCTVNGRCIYSDGFDEFHRTTIASADAVIHAAVMNRHWFRSVWKCYDDRLFYNGHRTGTAGFVTGYIISGPLRSESNLYEILEARAEVSGAYLADIVTDEDEAERTVRLIEGLADRVLLGLERGVRRPANFYGVGGMKIFRDLIYIMKGFMQEDHRFYKKHGLYDFPHRERSKILKMRLAGLALKLPKARARASTLMRDALMKQYEKIIDNPRL